MNSQPKTRRSKTAKPDDRRYLRARIGGRNDNRVFKFPPSVSVTECEDRVSKLKRVYEVCGGWNDLSNYIADFVRKGTSPIPVGKRMNLEPIGICDFENVGRQRERMALIESFPFLSWASLCDPATEGHEIQEKFRQIEYERFLYEARKLEQYGPLKIDNPLPISGSLHNALEDYLQEIKKEKPTNTDRHGKIKQLLVRHKDIALATLGLGACKEMIDYWRQRPPRHDGDGQYSVKRSREQLRELYQFFSWLHLSEKYGWQEPSDLHRLDKSIDTSGQKPKPFNQLTVPVFNVEELANLVQVAPMPHRLWILWCLNTSHGAAEVGRVQWGDIYLNQDHPWRKHGLNVPAGGNWIGCFRTKSKVVGWWHLWDETVELLLQWKEKCGHILGREPQPSEPIIIRSSGKPLYSDSRNAQSSFANAFDRIKQRCLELGLAVRDLPPGTLRNQFSDWCAGENVDDKVASLSLSHGSPHGSDKLLYNRYSNLPWAQLFKRQEEFRKHCQPVLDSLRLPPPLSPKRAELAGLWATIEGTGRQKLSKAAHLLNVSESTVFRWVKADSLEN